MAATAADVICIGNLVADVVGKPIDSLPARGQLALVERMELHAGGSAANTGIGLAKLGVSTSVIGKVGRDGFGDFLAGELARAGIDPADLVRDDRNATSSTMVLVHGDGERSFLHYLGANASLTLEDIDFSRVAQSRIMHIAGALLMPAFDGEPTARLLQQAKAAGLTTTMDTAWDARGQWLEKIGPCLPFVDYFLPSFAEAQMLAGGREQPEAIAGFLLDAGAKVVGLKMGEQGCYFQTRDGQAFQRGALSVPTVDALGAGDAFVAGFLTGLSKGWDVPACARLGCAAGAACVTALGATTGIRSLEATLELMQGANAVPDREAFAP